MIDGRIVRKPDMQEARKRVLAFIRHMMADPGDRKTGAGKSRNHANTPDLTLPWACSCRGPVHSWRQPIRFFEYLNRMVGTARTTEFF